MKKVKLIMVSLLAIFLFSFSSEVVNADSNIPSVLLGKTWKYHDVIKKTKNGKIVIISITHIIKFDEKITNSSHGYWSVTKKRSHKKVIHFKGFELLTNPVFTKISNNKYVMKADCLRSYADTENPKEYSTFQEKAFINIRNNKEITFSDADTKGYKPLVYKAE